jgi:ABC-2 type transport system ATP-binding protein
MQGRVDEIKRRYGHHKVRLKLENDAEATFLNALTGVQVTKRRQDYIEMTLQPNLSPNRVVETALQHGGIISLFELVEPSLTDIFIAQVGATALPDAPSVRSVS